MDRRVALLGSTGSIGRQTIDVIDNTSGLCITAIAASSNIEMAEAQIRKYGIGLAAMFDENAARELRRRTADLEVEVLSGIDGVCEIAARDNSDIVLSAVGGMVGIRPALAALDAKKPLALANKESLVAAGDIVMECSRRNNVAVLPVDSEHSAIFQCLRGGREKEIKKVVLTASGGPFYGLSREVLEGVSPQDALRHPNWSMGPKITIDSASLMNKGLEFIECMHLFGLSADKIDIVIHRESIVHSMVMFCDNSVIAQLSPPDMRLPIQYALCYPVREGAVIEQLDLCAVGKLTFGPPDLDVFGCLRLAIAAANAGGSMPAVLNGANEEAVSLFLGGGIKFTDIEKLVEKACSAHNIIKNPELDGIMDADRWSREYIKRAAAAL